MRSAEWGVLAHPPSLVHRAAGADPREWKGGAAAGLWSFYTISTPPALRWKEPSMECGSSLPLSRPEARSGPRLASKLAKDRAVASYRTPYHRPCAYSHEVNRHLKNVETPRRGFKPRCRTRVGFRGFTGSGKTPQCCHPEQQRRILLRVFSRQCEILPSLRSGPPAGSPESRVEKKGLTCFFSCKYRRSRLRGSCARLSFPRVGQRPMETPQNDSANEFFRSR